MSRWHLGPPLRQVTSSKEFSRLYRAMRARHQALDRFALPEDIWTFLEDRGPASHGTKDALLKALILEYQQNPSPLLAEFLAARFLPGVTAICRRFEGWFAVEPAEVTGQAWLCFYETLRTYDVARHPDRVAGCLMGMTSNRLRSWLRRELREARCQASLRMAAGGSGTRKSPEDGHRIPLDLRDLRSFWDRAETLLGTRETDDKRPDQETVRRADRLLSELVDKGALSESEKYVVMATSVAGRPLSEVVSGKEYQKAKKRRQRTLARLKLFLGQRAEREGISVLDVVRDLLGEKH